MKLWRVWSTDKRKEKKIFPSTLLIKECTIKAYGGADL
jgi:hypothetical protein